MSLSRAERLRAAYAEVLAAVGQEGQPGTADTPRRAASAMIEMTEGYDVDVEALFTVFEKDGYDEMIVIDGIPFASLCEHHILPFLGRAHVVYIPDSKVVGLSKIPRLVDAFAKRLQIQERLTEQIAEAMNKHLAPLGVLVVIEAEHMCATLRGVKKPGTMMRTSAIRGVFVDKPEARAEAFSLLAR